MLAISSPRSLPGGWARASSVPQLTPLFTPTQAGQPSNAIIHRDMVPPCATAGRRPGYAGSVTTPAASRASVSAARPISARICRVCSPILGAGPPARAGVELKRGAGLASRTRPAIGWSLSTKIPLAATWGSRGEVLDAVDPPERDVGRLEPRLGLVERELESARGGAGVEDRSQLVAVPLALADRGETGIASPRRSCRARRRVPRTRRRRAPSWSPSRRGTR